MMDSKDATGLGATQTEDWQELVIGFDWFSEAYMTTKQELPTQIDVDASLTNLRQEQEHLLTMRLKRGDQKSFGVMYGSVSLEAFF